MSKHIPPPIELPTCCDRHRCGVIGDCGALDEDALVSLADVAKEATAYFTPTNVSKVVLDLLPVTEGESAETTAKDDMLRGVAFRAMVAVGALDVAPRMAHAIVALADALRERMRLDSRPDSRP